MFRGYSAKYGPSKFEKNPKFFNNMSTQQHFGVEWVTDLHASLSSWMTFLCFREKQDKKPDNLQYKPIDKDQFIVEMVGYQGMFSSFMLLIK